MKISKPGQGVLAAMGVAIALTSNPTLAPAFKPVTHRSISGPALQSIVVVVEKEDGSTEELRFRPKAIVELNDANAATDDWGPGGGFWIEENHFDNEKMTSSSQRIIDHKNAVLALVTGETPNGTEARKRLGNALHSLQDFYSHSNWVEIFSAGGGHPDMGTGGVNEAMGRRTFSAAGSATAVCTSTVGYLYGDTTLIPGIAQITSGYFSIPRYCSNLPAGKCFHGVAECGGIHKDTPSETGHATAVTLARAATVDYLQQILTDPAIATGPNVKAIKALMGITGAPPLAFVIDTTGSMSEDISGVRARVRTMIESRLGKPEEPEAYILVGFNDPSVGPVLKTSESADFLAALDSLYASGGGDCPEPAMGGLLRAIRISPEQAQVFLFTDADASDAGLAGNVIAEAKAKKIAVNPIITGSCSTRRGLRAPGPRAVFDDVATGTGGLIFFINKDEVPGAMDVVEAAISTDLVDILAVRKNIDITNPTDRDDFPYTGPEMFIPDSADEGIEASVTVSGMTGLVQDLDVTFPAMGDCSTDELAALAHTYLSDLTITVISPDGTSVRLMDSQGGSGNNLCGTVFDDEAAQAIGGSSAPFTGRWRALDSLSTFDGKDPNGVWKLRVVDDAGGDVGSLRRFALSFSEATEAVVNEFPFPVDSTVSKLFVNLSVDSSRSIELFDPAGALVTAATPGVSITEVSTASIYTVNDPAPGAWKLSLAGQGEMSLQVKGISPLGMGSFKFVSVQNPAHEGYYPIPGLPVAGELNTALATMNGEFQTAAFRLLSEEGEPIQSVVMSLGDPLASEGEYIGLFVPPTTEFRAAVSGRDMAGLPYERLLPESFAVQPLAVDLDREKSGSQIPLSAGNSEITFTVRNFGPRDTFRLTPRAGDIPIVSTSVTEVTLERGQSALCVVQLAVPKVSVEPAVLMSLVAESTTRTGIANSSTVTLPLREDYSVFAYGGTPVAIGGAAPVEIPLTVSGVVGDLYDVVFAFGGSDDCVAPDGVGLSYSNVGDLDISLVSPLGTAVSLSGGASPPTGANFCRTLLDDAASGPLGAGVAPYRGSFRPDTPLSALDSEPPNGVWKLVVQGGSEGAGGMVRAFSLHILALGGLDRFLAYRDNLLGRVYTPGLNDLTADGRIDAADLLVSTRL
jgi:subtilisin-like proprotein convertase family protein